MFAGAQKERDWTCSALRGRGVVCGWSWSLRWMVILVFLGIVEPQAIVTLVGGFGCVKREP